MEDSPDLLRQLRLDRRPPEPPVRPRRLLVASAIGILAILGGAIGWRVRPTTPAVPVEPPVAVSALRQPTAPPARRSALEASGYVVARRQATVSADTTGRIRDVLVEEGQHVASGQVIARLDDSKAKAALAEATARLAEARADLDGARLAADNSARLFARNQKQYAAGLISAQAFDGDRASYQALEAERLTKQRAVEVMQAAQAIARRNCEETVVRAPFAGVITVKAAQPGEIVSPLSASGGFARTGIGTIVDMDSLEVEVDVSETFIGSVQPGQPATVRLNAYPDWDIPAEALAIVPAADRAKATVKVRVAFKTRDARILPDMGARVSFHSG